MENVIEIGSGIDCFGHFGHFLTGGYFVLIMFLIYALTNLHMRTRLSELFNSRILWHTIEIC